LTGKREGLVDPTHDGLFSSGTLGRYSGYLREIEEHQVEQMTETAAD
jgi:NADH-quinone oxidoreductase subunit G